MLKKTGKFNEKLFYNSYFPIYSFFPGSIYENPNNPKIKFDIDKAQQLLADAGWKEKNSDGYLVKNGRIFEVELPFYGVGQVFNHIPGRFEKGWHKNESQAN